jgi:hypothetical protein
LLELSDPFHHALSLVSSITDVPLQRSILVGVPGRGGGTGSKAMLRVTVREVGPEDTGKLFIQTNPLK